VIDMDGYTIREEVSRCRHSVLYRGLRECDNQSVLIRIYSTSNVTLDRIAKFKKELSEVRDIDSPGIVKILGIEYLRDGLAVILQDFQGISFREYFLDSNQDMRSFLGVAVQLVHTLIQLHKAGIIHKAVKPGNILVDKSGNARFVDLGLSFFITDETEDIYDPEVLQDTLPYISPEQTGRMNRLVDYRSDFYSFGITLYEILTGIPPFFANNPLEIIHCHIAKIPRAPDKIRPDIPGVVSAILLKMISKDQEDRYQSGFGLKRDLVNCLDQIEQTGRVEEFEIGKDDISERQVMSQKIYGRERQITKIIEAFDRISKGRSESLFVTGLAGVGKTALINEVNKPILQRNGYFIFGKFDRSQVDMPYSAVVQAFQRLVQQVLSEGKDRIERWRHLLLEGLGANGGVISAVIPEVELLIGKQSSPRELGPEETRNRFNLVFHNFLNVFAKDEHPLVVFLDDLQWADSASLHLLGSIMGDPGARCMLFIGAFRDDEVGGSHPLSLWIDEIRKTDMVLNLISLQPLGMMCVKQLIVETLRCDPASIDKLAQLVHRKTGGNPFFVKQFLKALHDEGMIRFSVESGWLWDMACIRRMPVTDNVADLMMSQILKFSESTREALSAASVFGNRFDLETVADVYGKSIEKVYDDLFEPLENGLIILTDTGYEFAHDRIQEAAYSLVSEEDRKQLHYRIGSLLLKSTKQEQIPGNVFILAGHLNAGVELICAPDERVQLANLNLLAGQRAKSSTAYEAASHYLQKGVGLLPPHAWEVEYDLALSLYTECGEAAFLVGDYARGENYFAEVLENARSPLDKIRVYEVRIDRYTVLNKRREALQLGIEALELLEFDMPKEADPRVIDEEMIALEYNMGQKKIDDLINLPGLTDPCKLGVARILASCSAPCYTSAPEYLVIMALKLINLSLQYGNSPYAAFAYVSYGVILCSRLDDIERGFRFGELSLELLNKFEAMELRAKVYYLFGDMINHWKRHSRDDIKYLMEAYRVGTETGDLAFASYSMNHHIITSFLIGEPLDQVKEKLEKYYEVMKKYDQLSVIQEYELWYQLVINLNCETEERLVIKGQICDEDDIVPEWERMNMLTAVGYYTVAKQLILYLYGAYRKSVEVSVAGVKAIDAMAGMNLVPEYYFYYSLSMLAHYPHAESKEQAEYLRQVEINQDKMENWALHAPENFKHKYLLVEAEKSRLNRDMESAVNLYDRAISLAQQNGYTQDEATANELAAKYFLSKGMEKVAGVYMREARRLFERWGAYLKVADMDERYAHLPVESTAKEPLFSTGRQSVKGPSSVALRILDHVGIIDSLMAISSEIILERLLDKLMQIIVINAGACRGIYLSSKEDGLFVEAEIDTSYGETSIIKSVPADERDDLLIPILLQVKHTMEHIVLADAGKEGDYTNDPYVLENQPKSILCLPIIMKSRLIGILYLENNIAVGAFTPDRVDVLRLIASQTAISLQNATLVDELQRTTEKLRESELRYRTLFEHSPVAIGISSLDGRIIEANDAMFEMSGYSRSEIGKVNLRDMYQDPEDRDILLKQMQLSGVVRDYEAGLISKDGSLYHCRLTSTSITIGDEDLLFFIIQDITERKRAADALRESEEWNRLLIETMIDGLGVQDENGLITYVNDSLCKMLGYSQDEMIGRRTNDLLDETNLRIWEEQMSGRRQGGRLAYEMRWSRKDGSQVPTIMSPSPILDDDGRFKGSFAVIIDITERKRAEEKIRSALKEKEVLLREIHHRVKNNLQVILSMLRLQAGRVEDEEYLDMFKESEARIRSIALVHDRLYESGDFADIDFCGYVNNLLCSLFTFYGVDHAKIALKIDIEDISLELDNAIPCGLIINELVSNSLKYAFPQGREGEIRVTLRSIDADEFQLSVSDNGEGIPEGLDLKNGGSMGLDVVRTLAEHQLGGTIELKRKDGTEFRIRFRRELYRRREAGLWRKQGS